MVQDWPSAPVPVALLYAGHAGMRGATAQKQQQVNSGGACSSTRGRSFNAVSLIRLTVASGDVLGSGALALAGQVLKHSRKAIDPCRSDRDKEIVFARHIAIATFWNVSSATQPPDVLCCPLPMTP